MTSSIFTDLKVFNAEQFVESVSEVSSNSKIYLTFGKTDAWSNEAAPATANSSQGTVYEVWSNMIGAKRVLGGDMHHVIPRNNWTANTVYFAYDHKTPNLFDHPNVKFHVVNSDYAVYKCISNNNGAVSTTEPTAINPDATSITADGYVWKYMYTISDSELLRFTTDNFIPVKTLQYDDGSLQWQVQDGAIDGSIERIAVTSGGNNYTNVSTITVTITGDGSSATAIPTINSVSNTVSSITITESGMGYTYATVTITDSGTGSGATAAAIISPPGGHGKNPLYELGGSSVIINPRLVYDEEGVLPVTNDYRQIALIKDPLDTTSNIISALSFVQAYSVTCDGSGDFTEDETVYQGTSLATATFSGRVVSWNSTTSELLLINIKGEPTSSQSINGSTSFTSRVITETQPGTARAYSGRILFVDNIIPITRADDQIEDFKILLQL